MNTTTARYQIIYGCFLILVGLLGYLSNPEKAKTALLTGGTFGGLSILWGVLVGRGVRWSLSAAIATTGVLALAFTWRASVSWLAVRNGHAEKTTAAVLITSMFVASVLLLPFLLKAWKAAPAAKSADLPS